MRVGLLCALLSLCAWPVQAQSVTRVAVIVVTFPDADPPDIQVMERTHQVMTRVDAFYVEQSYGRFLMQSDAFGVYTVPLDATATRFQIADAAKQAARDAGVDLGPYSKFLYVSPQINGTVGYGDALGAWIAHGSPVYEPSFSMAAHELGHHLFGLNHSHALICSDGTPTGDTRGATCQVLPYGDSLDVMGVGWGHVGALIKQNLGWLTATGPERIQAVTTSGDYRVTPYETPSGVKALTVVGGTNRAPVTYTLEYRQPIGFDTPVAPWSDPMNVYAGLVVHRAFNATELLRMTPPTPNDPYPVWKPALTLGQTYCDGKMSFSLLSADASGATVRVKVGGKCLT